MFLSSRLVWKKWRKSTLISKPVKIFWEKAVLVECRFVDSRIFWKPPSCGTLTWGYCRVQKEFAFEIVSRVVSTKRVMQWNIEHKWPMAMSVKYHCITIFVLTTSDAISNANSFCTLQHHYYLIFEIWNLKKIVKWGVLHWQY